jgi:hypothetical protein
MCHVCGHSCCKSNKTEGCGCDQCSHYLCWTNAKWTRWNDAGEPKPSEIFEQDQLDLLGGLPDKVDSA